MTFGAPWLLLGLLAVPAAVAGYVVAQRRRRRYAVRFTNLDLLSSVVTESPAWRRHLPAAVFLLAMTALLLATARPQVLERIPRDEASIVLVLDRSGSMRATDVEPTRLDAAIRAADRFIGDLPPKFRIGLVTFAMTADVDAALSTDHQQARSALRRIEAIGGTAMGDALDRAVSMVAGEVGDDGEQPAAAIVLLSDGANTVGTTEPIDAAAEARRVGVPVFTIALGTDDAVATVPGPFGERTVRVPPDRDTLRLIALTTRGRYFEAPSDADLQAVYDGLGTRIAYTVEPREVTAWAAAGALVLMLVAGGLSLAWFGRLP